MFQEWFIVAVALGYVSALFALAWIGDRSFRVSEAAGGRPVIYALSIAVYCTSWTFFGSVGLAAKTGYDFIPVYLGPILLFTLGWGLLLRIVRLAKSQNITSVADFLAARYGKSQAVAAVATVVAVVGTLPYIALQLKAVSVSIETLLGGSPLLAIELPRGGFSDTAFLITLALAAFAVLFGTRHVDATEHQDGLILAIAAESLDSYAVAPGRDPLRVEQPQGEQVPDRPDHHDRDLDEERRPRVLERVEHPLEEVLGAERIDEHLHAANAELAAGAEAADR